MARKKYFDFFKQLCTVTNCSGGEDSNPNKYTAGKWSFFTTNYDNILEDYWVKHRGYTELYLGFEQIKDKKVMFADRFLHNNAYDAPPRSNMQLVKLHGSINWIRHKKGEIEEHGYYLSLDDLRSRSGSSDIQEEMLIYPLSQKQLYFTPYIQLFGILEAELKKRDLWIIIGYSFRDIIIRTMFEKSLAENARNKLLLVHPHATQEIKPLFQDYVRRQVICLDTYFASQPKL